VSPAAQQADVLLADLPERIAISQQVAADIYAEWSKGLVR
jgi:hypothetical protein